MGATSAYGVLVYWPNLIGYLRIFCMLGSFYYHCYHEDWVMFLALYLAAFCGDVVDGYVARLFHQQSVFGGVLDMVTDRVSTCGLLTILASIPAYKSMRFPFVLLIALDIFSHWFHVSSVQGHHKSSEVLAHRNPLLRWYYSVYPLFGFCCVGTELFYVFLYFQSFKDKNAAFKMSSEAEDAALYLGFTGATFLALTYHTPPPPLPLPSPYPPPLFFPPQPACSSKPSTSCNSAPPPLRWRSRTPLLPSARRREKHKNLRHNVPPAEDARSSGGPSKREFFVSSMTYFFITIDVGVLLGILQSVISAVTFPKQKVLANRGARKGVDSSDCLRGAGFGGYMGGFPPLPGPPRQPALGGRTLVPPPKSLAVSE